MSLEADLLSSYHNLAYTVAHAKINIYPEFTKQDVTKIPEETAKKIIDNVVSHRLASVKKSSRKPHVELVLGYPGAGKTLVEEELSLRYPNELIKVDYDEFRSYDKRVLAVSDKNPLVADYFYQIPCGIKDTLLDEAAKEGKSVLLSAPALDIKANPQNSLKAMFIDRGYRINVTYTAANENLCYLSNFTRHFKSRLNNLNNPGGKREIPRVITPEVHKVISAGTRHNIHELVSLADQGFDIGFTMVDRNNKPFEVNDIHAISVLAAKNERRLPLTPPEMKRLIVEMDIIAKAVETVGINKLEKKLLDGLVNGALYERLIAKSLPLKMPTFVHHQGR